LVIAQVIEIEYDAQTRGGPAAIARARQTRHVPLPPTSGDVVHAHALSFFEGIAPRTTSRALVFEDGAAAIAHDVLVRHAGERLEVWRTSTLFELARGTWGRVSWSEARDQTRREIIVNVGWFDAPPLPHVFLGAPKISVRAPRPR
jgi:hypothetical protein